MVSSISGVLVVMVSSNFRIFGLSLSRPYRPFLGILDYDEFICF